MKTIIINLKQPEEMPPKSNATSYAIAARRGPSVGKSAWKPGGTAHKAYCVTMYLPNKPALSWTVDAVTGKRIAPVHHAPAMHVHLKAEKLEQRFRRLIEKAHTLGLTAREWELLQDIVQADTIRSKHSLLALYDQITFKPSDRGHVLTRRNAKRHQTTRGVKLG